MKTNYKFIGSMTFEQTFALGCKQNIQIKRKRFFITIFCITVEFS